MSRVQVLGLSLPAVLLILAFSNVADNAAVRDNSRAVHPKGPAQQQQQQQRVFVAGSDASDFFKRRSRRSGRYYAELLAEQRAQISASKRWREHNEERRSAHENYAEELRDEQNERSRERNEQYREFHYDGLYPRQYWFH